MLSVGVCIFKKDFYDEKKDFRDRRRIYKVKVLNMVSVMAVTAVRRTV